MTLPKSSVSFYAPSPVNRDVYWSGLQNIFSQYTRKKDVSLHDIFDNFLPPALPCNLFLLKPQFVPRTLQIRPDWVWQPEEVQCSLQSPECVQCGWEGTGAYQAAGPRRWVGKASTETWSIPISHTDGLTLPTKALSWRLLSETDSWVWWLEDYWN